MSILFSGCTKDRSAPIVNASEILVAAERENGNVRILAETERIYNCSNYSIVYDKQNLGPTIRIDFERIESPNVCLLSLGPARAFIELGSLNKGSYDLKFRYRGKTTDGTLSADPLSLELEDEGKVGEL